MHRLLKTYFVLLPLMVLVALPCSAKRGIKVLMNIVPGEQVNFSKKENVKLCANSALWTGQVREAVKDLNSNLFLGFDIYSVLGSPLQTAQVGWRSSLPSAVFFPSPRFILHRRLII